jgi:hypothetical protein
MSGEPPVIVLAFSNDKDDHLQMVDRERRVLAKALAGHAKKGSIEVWKEKSTSLRELFTKLDEYLGRIAIFHYGGHANGSALELVADAGDGNERAGADGLADRFGQEAGLQLVFLNGCATRGHVEALLGNNVKAVIATSVPIQDRMATDFAQMFYESLAKRLTIAQAFRSAAAFVATRYGKDMQPRLRDLGSDAEEPADDPVDPGKTWGLYFRNEGRGALDWRLPETPAQQIIIRGQRGAENPDINTRLITVLLEALQATSESFKRNLAAKMEEDDFAERNVPQLIFDAFPTPVGVQLRRLFSGHRLDLQRLHDLVLTYEIMIKLFCFSMLAQLWDMRIANPDLKISEEGRTALNRFMTITGETAATFDYYQLILALVQIVLDNGEKPFMAECKALLTELTDGPSSTAHAFMEEMRHELRGQIPPEEVASFCTQAEEHLAVILADLAFVVLYKPATIKAVEVKKYRNGKIQFVHTMVPLDKASVDPQLAFPPYETFTDSPSVILQKSRKMGGDYVNLTPFVIDKSAGGPLEAAYQLFFFSHYNVAEDACHYVLANEPETTLVVGNDLKPVDEQPGVKAMFDWFRAAVLAE